jgi:hypothetical protein
VSVPQEAMRRKGRFKDYGAGVENLAFILTLQFCAFCASCGHLLPLKRWLLRGQRRWLMRMGFTPLPQNRGLNPRHPRNPRLNGLGFASIGVHSRFKKLGLQPNQRDREVASPPQLAEGRHKKGRRDDGLRESEIANAIRSS